MGQFYAQYQWHTGGLSSDIVDQIPPEWLASAYPGLHDLDMKLAIEKVAAEVGMGRNAHADSCVAEPPAEYAAGPTPPAAPARIPNLNLSRSFDVPDGNVSARRDFFVAMTHFPLDFPKNLSIIRKTDANQASDAHRRRRRHNTTKDNA